MPKKIAKSQRRKTCSLSIFLIREELDIKDAIKQGLECISVRGIGNLYVRQNAKKQPKWLAFFGDFLTQTPRLYSASNGALLMVTRGKRVFAVSFGLGRHLLEAGTWEERFGLRVTLNSVDPDRLKSVDRSTFDAISSHTRTQASREGDVTAFGLNIEQDLLRAATGSPMNEVLGKRMTGMDSLLVTVPVTIQSLPALLDRYLVQFADNAYKKTFPWVDHIGEVRDAKLRESLDQQLLDRIKAPESPDSPTWLAVPELIEWAEISGFRYTAAMSGELYPDLHIRDFLKSVAQPDELTTDGLRKRHIFAYGPEDDDGWTKRWTVYSCLYGEVKRDRTLYLLSGGKWYRVEHDFVATVDKAVAKLVSESTLPAYTDKSEGDYNRRVAKASAGKLALLDRDLIRVGGTTVEFCDLYAAGRTMIHVKRYGGSSILSHLFAQGSVAANAFLEDAAFRAAVNAKLPVSHRFKDPAQRPEPASYEINYSIVSRSTKRIDRALPFFSRLNLRNAARQLQAFGFNVTLSKIQA